MPTTRLSMERVFMTPKQVQDVSKAIQEKKPWKLKLKANQLVGNHPIYVDAKTKDRLTKARIIGKGCSCDLSTESYPRMEKTGKGLYSFQGMQNMDTGEGMFMFGDKVRGTKAKRPPTVAPAPKEVVVTGNTSASVPTFEDKKEGNGLYMFGSGFNDYRVIKSSYGGDYNTPFPQSFK